MILVDTNVVSEPMRTQPDPAVVDWLNQQDAAQLYISTITIAEIEFGIACLPTGKRKKSLAAAFQNFVEQAFGARVLSFDTDAARIYGNISAKRRANGQPISTLDAQIAAIAIAHGFAIATRNTKDFAGLGVELINPFDHQSEPTQ